MSSLDDGRAEDQNWSFCPFRTPFTREERYNYVDPDYAYTEEERKRIEIHDNAYNQLFDEQRYQRSEVKRTK